MVEGEEKEGGTKGGREGRKNGKMEGRERKEGWAGGGQERGRCKHVKETSQEEEGT